MNLLLPHRVWMGLIAAAALLYFSATPMVDYLQDRETHVAQKLKAERTQVEQSLHQLEDDIATAQKLGSQMDNAEIARLLSPVDRLKIASMLERQAAAAHFQNFTYTLAPEQKMTVSTPGAGLQEFAQSEITLSADAPLDTNVYAFIDQVRQLLPGRAQLQSLTLERTGNADADIGSSNVHMAATFQWLSTGTGKTIVGGL